MPTNKVESFANPDKKPLEELSFSVVTDGVVQSIKALDKYWAPREVFATYLSLINSCGIAKTGAELDEWFYEAESFRDDMEFLLTRKHHIFWSYMVYQKPALAAVATFLQRSVPYYLNLNEQNTNPKAIALYQQIVNLVVRIICRIITNKETAEEWITRNHLRHLIYTNYLISVPMLIDMIITVGIAETQNISLLMKITSTLLNIEPNYGNDFKSALIFYQTAFRSIQTQAENEGFEGAGGGEPDDNMETPYDDVALYTMDCSYSLNALLEVNPNLCDVCEDIKLAQSIAHFYDTSIPYLFKNICLINENAKSLLWINQARIQFLKAFRCIVRNSYLLKTDLEPQSNLENKEKFIALFTECLSEQTFVIDYGNRYSMEWDIEILGNSCKDLDTFKTNFILKGYQTESKEAKRNIIGEKESLIQSQLDNMNTIKSIPTPSSHHLSVVNDSNNDKNEGNIRDIDAEVQTVLEVFPDLGTGFIHRVLTCYENCEEAIAAILENNLPPNLYNADRSEVHIPSDAQDKFYIETGIRHLNIYDGDEYDVMTRDNPNCIIKQGKGFPNAPKNIAELLDDKSELADVRHRYQQYSLVAEDEDKEYEDEYDDSYEAILESETRTLKPKELKNVMADIDDLSEEDDEEETSDENQESQSVKENKRLNFCENPEDVRARYEAKRQAQWDNRSHTARNVVGNKKGQGQAKETVLNRRRKEKNKATNSNHNRKAGADYKRSKGML